jgi:uncharacterized protein YkwD
MRKRKKKHINFLDGLSSRDILDSDADGLTDSQEKELGTDPYSKDTDRDGLGDLEEINVYGTDPLDQDTDQDGMPDGEEVKKGRNPKGPGKLKDLFLAHEGNNYRPHAFHPKRLLFYSASSLILKGMLIAVVVFSPISAWLTPDILSQESEKVVDLTNQLREQQGVPPLQKSELLAQTANQKCRDMLMNQYFAHVSPDQDSITTWLERGGYDFAAAGENLAMGFSQAEELVQAWEDSKTHRQNLLDTDYKEIGVAMMSGDYKDVETTFATQHFGAPIIKEKTQTETVEPAKLAKAEEEIPFEAPPKASLEKETQKEAPVPAEDSQQEELSSRQELKQEKSFDNEQATSSLFRLPQPELRLNSPKLTDRNLIEAEITAPGAEKVRIYSGDKIIKTVSLGVFKNVTVDVELSEGKNKLRVESVAGDKATSSPTQVLTVDSTPPRLAYAGTELTVDEPTGQDSIVVKAKAELSKETRQANLEFGGYRLRLNQTGPTTWEGEEILPKEEKEEIFNPVVPATLTAVDRTGNTLSQGVGWKNVKPLKTSLAEQYFFLKSNPSRYLKPLFDITSIYYTILLVLACLIMLVNVIWDIRRQKGHVILSAVSFSVFLFLLIIF